MLPIQFYLNIYTVKKLIFYKTFQFFIKVFMYILIYIYTLTKDKGKRSQSNGNIMHHNMSNARTHRLYYVSFVICTLNRSSGYVTISSMEPQLYLMTAIPLFTHRHNKHMHSDKLCELQS